MTKQGGFKRAVRKRARESGQRYTEARAAMDKGKSAVPLHRPFEHAAVKAHLEERYGIRITSLASIDGHQPATLRVHREDGPDWVARIFSHPADEVSCVEGDAEILRFLALHDFPAERVAHDEPVSVLDGHGVLVTEFVEGGSPFSWTNPQVTPAVQYELAGLLGRLHTLPAAGGAMARDGGSFGHDPGPYLGRPRADLAAAMSFLVSVEDAVASHGREKFEWLRDQVENADDGEGLPEAFTHGNFHAKCAVGKRGNLVIVGWGGSGRGPRLPALAWLLWTTHGAADHIEAIARAYREHVQLTDEEMDRLAGVMNMRSLYLLCADYRASVRNGHTPTLDEPGFLSWRPDDGERLAAQAIVALGCDGS
ncbi:MAG: phosphotransferase enzyme family protein [Vicinamibacterales bacterium]